MKEIVRTGGREGGREGGSKNRSSSAYGRTLY